MARKGSTKVRTGCLTCKTRKVKCDEERPHCQRCVKTGRKCQGYPVPPQGQAAYSWADLLSAQHSSMTISRRTPSDIYSLDTMESRALEYFRIQVAPVFSRHSSRNFWNVVVSQIGHEQPAVRHALSCIGSLYEGLGAKGNDFWHESQETFAITQYNKAVSHLTQPNVDQSIVLLVCMLFICIETIHRNKDMAIQHCRHGVNICNEPSTQLSPWAQNELRPIFLRLATVPHFFGMDTSNFPEPVGLSKNPLELDSDLEGKILWASMVNRSVRLIRQGICHRQGPERSSPAPDAWHQEQQDILRRLKPWRQHFQMQTLDPSMAEEEIESRIHQHMECIIGQIWVACCLDSSETCYDRHDDEFEDLLQLSQRAIVLRTSSGPMPKFIFEMGFLPFFYFVAINCRRLHIRLRALQHMLLIAHDRENLFDFKTSYNVGMRVVEKEHGIQLDPSWPEHPAASAMPLPSKDARITSADIMEEVESRPDGEGSVAEYRKVFFVVRPGAIVPGYAEWVKIVSPPRYGGVVPLDPQ